MKEMIEEKRAEVDTGSEQGGMDLMGAMVRAAGGSGDQKGQKPLLTQEEIMGNAFVVILAGHETTANSIHFSLIFLAMHVASQRRLQAELDDIFQGRSPSEWSYDQDLPRLFAGLPGAIMAEELRLMPPVPELPRSAVLPQPMTSNGRRYVVPANTLINISAAIAHRHPAYWPHGPPSDPARPTHPTSNVDNDLEEFNPERWFTGDRFPYEFNTVLEGAELDGEPWHEKGSDTTYKNRAVNKTINNNQKLASPSTSTSALVESEDAGLGPGTAGSSADPPTSLFKPAKGAYLPFSEGVRSCIGRRFAQVEFLAVLAVIMSEWSVELAVDDYLPLFETNRNPDSKSGSSSNSKTQKPKKENEKGASLPNYYARLDALIDAQKSAAWGEARDEAARVFRDDMMSLITLQIKEGQCVPLRFVRRGRERFTGV